MSTWLVVGSSSSAPQGMATAFARHDFKYTITCNGGIKLISVPTFYALIDHEACRIYQQEAKIASYKGTQCISLIRDHHALKERQVDWFPILLPEGHPYEPFQLSGLWCAEFACRSGADTVVLVGMDGYPSKPEDHHHFYPGIPVERTQHYCRFTPNIVHPKMATLVAKYPAVQWILYGEPLFRLEAPNWQVHAVQPSSQHGAGARESLAKTSAELTDYPW